jgi:hypothetical protein
LTHKSIRQIHLPDESIRDPSITPNDFTLLLYLKAAIYDHNNKYSFYEDINKLKYWVNIKDNKTLKKSLVSLFDSGYLLIKTPDKFVQGKPVNFSLNKSKLDTEGKTFTMLPITILEMVRDTTITREAARLLYYYESRINRKIPDRHFCFPSEQTISRETNIKDPKTIRKHNKLLSQKYLIKIEKHKITWDYQYDEKDMPIFNKYNNHYYVNLDKMC